MNMLKTLLSAIAGGLIVLVGLALTEQGPGSDLSVNYKDGEPDESYTLYTRNEEGEAIPIDFTVTAELVNESVVHITSFGTPENTQRMQPLPDPFRDFFGDEFERFFQRPQPQQPESREPRPMGTGSGVIINPEGYIVTNFHVIRNAEKLSVTLLDNQSFDASVVGTDPTTDLALLKIDKKGLPALTLVNSDNVKVGQWVMAVGNPFNLNATVTAGIVSAKARRINILTEQYAVESFIQTDAAINPGNSGGALVNLKGELIGINTAIASPTGAYAGYGFAIPSNLVNKVVNDLLKYGKVQRAVLGVTIANNNSVLAKEKGLDFTSGVYIDSVATGSTAEKAGIKPGDVIVGINGDEIVNSAELMAEIAEKKPGEIIEVTIRRGDDRQNLRVELQQLDREEKPELAYAEDQQILRDLGVQISTLSGEEAEELGIEGGIRINKLYPGKIIQETRIREGFIIIGVDKKKVHSVDEFAEALRRSEGGVLIEGLYPGDSEKRYFGLSVS